METELLDLEQLFLGWIPKHGIINVNGVEYNIDNVLVIGKGEDLQFIFNAKIDEV